MPIGYAAGATTVFGNLNDITDQGLNTKLMFAPTNEVMVAPSGLNAGPPKIITTLNGAFSLPLEPGDYTVSLPLITWRHPFQISVFDSASPVNITNLLTAPRTYIYTNPFVPPLHVNTARVTALSTSGETSLLTSPATIGAGSLAAGRTITIEAYGSYVDPGANAPSVTFKLKLGSTALYSDTQPAATANWHLHALITIRTVGTTGSAAASVIIRDDAGLTPFSQSTTVFTLNTTVSLNVDLTGTIANFTGAEAIRCDQLIIHLE